MKNIVAVGNFDGVHTGHRQVFRAAKELAETYACGTVAFTFDNHPRNFFAPGSVKLLRGRRHKECLIRRSGIDRVVSVPFDLPFSEQSPEQFLRMLKETVGCLGIVCGENFQFGHSGTGSARTLHDFASAQGLRSRVVALYRDERGNAVSSSLIRGLITAGQIESAAEMLGEPYMLSGKIIHGRAFGRKIGFPTVNFPFPFEFVLPKFGVYSTFVKINRSVFSAVTNIGVCPTVTSAGTVTVESHIIESCGQSLDFYGKQAQVWLCSFIRPERKFQDSAALSDQIETDKNIAAAKLEQLDRKFIDFE